MFGLIASALSGLTGDNPQPKKEETKVVDDALLRKTILDSIKTLDEFKKLMDRELVKILRMETATLSAKLALSTPPLNKGSVKNAEDNIEGEINYIFTPLETIPFGELVMAKQWPAVAAYDFKFKSQRLQKAYEDGNWDVIYKAFAKGGMGEFGLPKHDDIEVITRPNQNFHRAGRDARTGKLSGRRFFVAGSKDHAQGLIDDQVAKAKQAIGQMAGGWVSCYMKLQGTGYALPAEYASKGKGYVKTKWWGNEKEVEISNPVGNFAGYLDQRRGTFQFIIDDAMKRTETRYVANAEAILSKLNMK